MKREELLQNKKKHLLCYFTCDNDKTDLVSGVELQRSISMEPNHYSEPLFIQDPTNPNRKCVRKQSGSCYMTPNISLYNQTAATPRFSWWWTLSETNSIRNGHHIVQFDVYVDSSSTTRVIYNDGDVECAGGNNGIGIWVKNGYICTIRANNSSEITTSVLCHLNDIANKWNTITIEYVENETVSDVHIVLKNDTNVYEHTDTLLTPTSGSARNVMLAGSHYSYYSGAQDTVDLFKEIKVFEFDK